MRNLSTVPFIWESTMPCYCSTLALFETSLDMLRVLPHLSPFWSYLPLLRALKWGTVWPCTSRDITNMTGHIRKHLHLFIKSWSLNFELSYFQYPLRYSSSFESSQIWYLWERWLHCGCTSCICQGNLNSDNLLHKLGFLKTQLLDTVWHVWKCLDKFLDDWASLNKFT